MNSLFIVVNVHTITVHQLTSTHAECFISHIMQSKFHYFYMENNAEMGSRTCNQSQEMHFHAANAKICYLYVQLEYKSRKNFTSSR